MILLFGLVIVICYWALRQPEAAFKPGWKRRAIALAVLAYGVIVLLSAWSGSPFYSLLFVAYPLIYGVLLRRPVRALVNRINPVIVVFGLLWFSELFAALDIADRDPVGRHMVVYAGFYVGLALVVTFFLSRWRFTFATLFTVGGLWGVLIEQQFAGPVMLLAGDFAGFALFASLIFGVYGLYLAGPFLLFYEEWSANPNRSRLQAPLLLVAVAGVPLLTWAIWTGLLGLLGYDTTVLVV
jgi:hypothetical protein